MYTSTTSMLLLVILYFCLELASASFIPSDDHAHLHRGGPGKPLGRAFAKPPNVATDLDCFIKELAYDYAKNLLTAVSVII